MYSSGISGAPDALRGSKNTLRRTVIVVRGKLAELRHRRFRKIETLAEVQYRSYSQIYMMLKRYAYVF